MPDLTGASDNDLPASVERVIKQQKLNKAGVKPALTYYSREITLR